MGATLAPPIFAILISLIVYFLVLKMIKNAENPYRKAIEYLPVIGFVKITLVFFLSLKYGLSLSPNWAIFSISLIAGSCAATLLYLYG